MNIPTQVSTQDLQDILNKRQTNKEILVKEILADFELEDNVENREQAILTIKRNQEQGTVDQNYTHVQALDYKRILDNFSSEEYKIAVSLNFLREALMEYDMMTNSVPIHVVLAIIKDNLTECDKKKVKNFMTKDVNFTMFVALKYMHEQGLV